MLFFYEGNSLKSGIYEIRNRISNKSYIGQASRFKKRWDDHKKSLLEKSKSYKTNKHLKNSFNNYKELGYSNFLEFHVLEVMENSTKEQRTEREEWWIKEYIKEGIKLYNNDLEPKKSKERSCFSHTPEETKAILSEKSKELWQNPEHKEKVSAKQKEFWNTPEGKQRASKRANKIWQSKEHQEMMSQTSKQRHENMSLEEKQQIQNNLAKGRTKESYEKRKQEYREELKQNIQIKEEKDFIGKKSNRAKMFENANLLSPDGILYRNVFNLHNFGIQFNLDSWKLQQVIENTRPSYKGWIKL